MNPAPLVSYRDVDQALAGKGTQTGDQGGLPEKTEERNKDTGEMTHTEPETDHHSEHGAANVLEICGKTDQITHYLENMGN